MTPISAIAMVGFTAAEAGAASGLFNMMRNLGGAIGTAAIETFFTKREQLHSAIITPEGGRSEPGRQRGCGCLISPGPICGVERVR
jgi:DHA2 family multidrug resistance protein